MKDLLKTIWKILRSVDRIFTIFRNAVINIILLFLLVSVSITIFHSTDKKEDSQKIPENSILKISIVGNIVEQHRFPEPLQKFLEDLEETPRKETYMQDILDAIEYAAHDGRISAILLDTSKMTGAGLNQLQTIGEALLYFRRNGKQVIAAADSYPQGHYFLASYASKIFLNPMGKVDIQGMKRYSLYFKDAIDKLHIDYNIFKVGAYKSATEPFSRNSMSEADKQQSRIWLDALWRDFSSRITKNRRLATDSLQLYIENIDQELQKAGGDSARLALNKGLVDALSTRQEIRDYLRTLCKKNKNSKVNYLTIDNYLDYSEISPSYTVSRGAIAIIVAEGIIIDGKERNGTIGSDSLARRIRQAKDTPEVEALVLRINSGGGSAFASEIIRQELLNFKKSGKKLIVSMGAIAASGGYWISANADEIWASPSTLTGSIGVFGALPTFQRSLAHIGIHSDGISTAPHVQSQVPLQALSPVMRSVLQQSVEHTYRTFINIVAGGRKMKKEEVEKIAQGRVYDGIEAKNIGLVDNIGELEQAIDAAKRLIRQQDAKAFYIRPEQTIRQQVLGLLNSVRTQSGLSLLPFFTSKELNTLLQEVQTTDIPLLTTMHDRNNIYSYTPPLRLDSFSPGWSF